MEYLDHTILKLQKLRLNLSVKIKKKTYSSEIKKYQMGSVRILTHANYDNSALPLRDTSLTICATTLPKKVFDGTLLSLISLIDPRDKVTRQGVRTHSVLYGISGIKIFNKHIVCIMRATR